jgi:hypothetical protein
MKLEVSTIEILTILAAIEEATDYICRDENRAVGVEHESYVGKMWDIHGRLHAMLAHSG